jgi:translation initiation factor 3 subunit F
MIYETLVLLSTTDSSEFDKILANGLQDVLMVVYLANLTRTHLLLAEKLREQATTSTISLQP